VSSAVQSPGMAPKTYIPHWQCRHCKHTWQIKNEREKPKQCPNRECRAADWDREKIKEGRPRKPGRPRGHRRRK